MVVDQKDLATNVEAVDQGSSEAILGRSDADLPEKRELDLDEILPKRRFQHRPLSHAVLPRRHGPG